MSRPTKWRRASPGSVSVELHARIDAHLEKYLRAYAFRRNVSLSMLIGDIIREHLVTHHRCAVYSGERERCKLLRGHSGPHMYGKKKHTHGKSTETYH